MECMLQFLERRRFTLVRDPVAVDIPAAGLLIFLLSISLGWHYALDGIVGGAAAWLCCKALRHYFAGRSARGPQIALAA